MTRLIFSNWGVLQRRTFFDLNLALTLGTHTRNNPSHCSKLLSELLVFELNFCKYWPHGWLA